jgi:four helix bundle protein
MYGKGEEGKSLIKKVEELVVFKKAHALTIRLYKITAGFPEQEKFGLISQMRRASASICANLMEGSHRIGRNEFRHFVGIARGSVGELKYHLLLAKDLGYIELTLFDNLIDELNIVSKMLYGLIKSLSYSPTPTDTDTHTHTDTPTYLSHPISQDTPLYGGAKNISIKQDKAIAQGDSCNTLYLSFPNHVSTHVDLPFHFLPDGKRLEDFGPENWIFKKVILLDIPDVQMCEIICQEKIEALLPDDPQTELILLRTGFEKYRGEEVYWKSPPGLHPELAVFFKKRFPALRAVGMDIISVSSWCDRALGRKAHYEFLRREILLIEDMKLSPLKESPEMVIGLPLLVKEADAVPVTMIGILS